MPRSSKLLPFLRLLYVPRNLTLQVSAQDTIHIAYLDCPVTSLHGTDRQYYVVEMQHVDCVWEMHFHVLFRTILLITVFPIGQQAVFLKNELDF
jgi:hypothetical protein